MKNIETLNFRGSPSIQVQQLNECSAPEADESLQRFASWVKPLYGITT